MMSRSTVVLVSAAIIGGSLMLGTAVLAQTADQVTQPAHQAPGMLLALLGPSASGIVGALVVAVYNKVVAFDRRLEELEQSLGSRPCIAGQCSEVIKLRRRRANDPPEADYAEQRGGWE